MTETPYVYTPEQRQLLHDRPHYHPVSFLDDGDLLIAEDAGPISRDEHETKLTFWAVWVLTRDGEVHTPEHHLTMYHPWWSDIAHREILEPERARAAYVAPILSMDQATIYLFDTYRVNVHPRTVRNWCVDHKLAAGRLGTTSNAPWYTTSDALDQYSTRPSFPDPDPDAPTLAEYEKELGHGLRTHDAAPSPDPGA